MNNRNEAKKYVFLFDLSALSPTGHGIGYRASIVVTLRKLQHAGHTIVLVNSSTANGPRTFQLENCSYKVHNLSELIDRDQPEGLRIFVHGDLPPDIFEQLEQRGYTPFSLMRKSDPYITKPLRYQSLIESYCPEELDHWRQETGRRRRETSNIHPVTLGTMVAAGFLVVATVITAACTGGLAPVILGAIAIVLAFASFVSACVHRVSESTATSSPSLSSR